MLSTDFSINRTKSEGPVGRIGDELRYIRQLLSTRNK